MGQKFGFTLAEVLITLGIIGVVASITIPTLVVQNQEKGWNTAAAVFERKLEESLKIMNTQGTLAGYRTTEQFVSELQKHLKITKVCKNDDILSCFEDEITWNIVDVSSGSESELIDISKIKTASDLGQKDWNTNAVGIQLNNGTSAVIAYNPNCIQDPYSNQIKGTSCVSMLYDTSGFTKPNTSGKDVRGINSSLNIYAFKVDGVYFSVPFNPQFLTKEQCEASKGDLGISSCHYDNDFWAGSVAACGGVDKLPTPGQLAKIANYIYNTNEIGTNNLNVTDLKMDTSKAASLGFKFSSGTFSVWSGLEQSSYNAYNLYFYNNRINYVGSGRSYDYKYAVCLGN